MDLNELKLRWYITKLLVDKKQIAFKKYENSIEKKIQSEISKTISMFLDDLKNLNREG